MTPSSPVHSLFSSEPDLSSESDLSSKSDLEALFKDDPSFKTIYDTTNSLINEGQKEISRPTSMAASSTIAGSRNSGVDMNPIDWCIQMLNSINPDTEELAFYIDNIQFAFEVLFLELRKNTNDLRNQTPSKEGNRRFRMKDSNPLTSRKGKNAIPNTYGNLSHSYGAPLSPSHTAETGAIRRHRISAPERLSSSVNKRTSRSIARSHSQARSVSVESKLSLGSLWSIIEVEESTHAGEVSDLEKRVNEELKNLKGNFVHYQKAVENESHKIAAHKEALLLSLGNLKDLQTELNTKIELQKNTSQTDIGAGVNLVV